MKIDVRIDAMNYTITSRDPDTVARWLIETFSEVHWNPSTWCQVYVYPTFDRDGQNPDYFTNTHYMEPFVHVKSPREFAKALRDRIDYHMGAEDVG